MFDHFEFVNLLVAAVINVSKELWKKFGSKLITYFKERKPAINENVLADKTISGVVKKTRVRTAGKNFLIHRHWGKIIVVVIAIIGALNLVNTIVVSNKELREEQMFYQYLNETFTAQMNNPVPSKPRSDNKTDKKTSRKRLQHKKNNSHSKVYKKKIRKFTVVKNQLQRYKPLNPSLPLVKAAADSASGFFEFDFNYYKINTELATLIRNENVPVNSVKIETNKKDLYFGDFLKNRLEQDKHMQVNFEVNEQLVISGPNLWYVHKGEDNIFTIYLDKNIDRLK